MYRNKKLLIAAKDRPCVMCGNRGTTVACHANGHEFGKGTGCKAHDWAIAFLCQTCHATVDGRFGRLDREEQRELWMHGWIRTLTILFDEEILMVNTKRKLGVGK